MASLPTYLDGKPIEDGDWVLLERGAIYGRVTEIIDSEEAAKRSSLSGPGIVVDAPPGGYVFLSSDILNEDPLQFVRRGPREGMRMGLGLLMGIGFLLVIPALYSFASAVYSALTTGEVVVVMVGRTETRHMLVPWTQGWARFAGPIVLIASLLATDSSRGLYARWWFAAFGTVAGLILLSQSGWFVSFDSAAVLLGMIGAAVVASLLKRRFGTEAAFGFLLFCVGALLWRAYSAI
jgi:hypothetical protein